jgi:uncharacterized membrane protein
MPKTKRPKTKKPRIFTSSLPKRNLPSSQVTQVSVSRSAPLPHPSELEGYEAILPGAAERIFALVENQSNHRQGLENKHYLWKAEIVYLGLSQGDL